MCMGRGRTGNGKSSISIRACSNAARLNVLSAIQGNIFGATDSEIPTILKCLTSMHVISAYLAKAKLSC